MENAGLGTIGEYITRRHRSVDQYIDMRKNIGIAVAEDRRGSQDPLQSCAGGNRRAHRLVMKGGVWKSRRWSCSW